ncbi:MAG: hypothetical protein IH589_06660 [Anaerolineales bacterium]|nr:hypothetical protein [Anaerolineales bacterium]
MPDSQNVNKRPTVCDIVPERSEWDTCAGAGTAKPSSQKNGKAQKTA